ncbi:MAG: glycoside hydrolase family 2 TIM barrel-domain containing protein, partial [Rhodopirellula sp. JB053]
MKMLNLIAFVCLFASASHAAPQAERVYLSGKGPSDAVEWDFFCSAGRRSGQWATIPVPSNWEQHGFGNYNYGRDEYSSKHDETGTYRTTFMVPMAWKNKHVRLVFEGSMTQTSIKINGKPVGFPNFGGYLPFRYILDKTNIQYGKKNTLEVLVKKKPDYEGLDQAERQADYWIFGGIYRPVYLEVQPREFVNRVAVDARADGSLRLDVFPQVQYATRFREEFKPYVDEVVAQVQTLEGKNVGEPMTSVIHGATGRIRFSTKIDNPKVWSPEYPNLYQVKVTLKNEGKALSEKVERFGFRTFELRPAEGLYLNGTRVMIQGVNRNVFDPIHGRAVDSEKIWKDARAIKAMNVNLVRSHMPPNKEFMDACDELGMLVITELTNWHDPVTETPIARNNVYELVTKYQNHPSVILWANGNENGFNLEVDDLYHLYDLQDRPVIHPWTYFEGLNTKHYPEYKELLKRISFPQLYLPTEFLHGLYDGGHGAGLQDIWNTMRQSPVAVGGVLWCWADAAIKRTDEDGKLDTAGNQSADGIVGPNGEREASYFTVREIWSPIQIATEKLSADFRGELPVENRYYDTSLNDCSFRWRLLDCPGPLSESATCSVRAEGRMNGPNIGPGEKGTLTLPLPAEDHESHVLELTAYSRTNVEVMKWSWQIGTSEISFAMDSKTNLARVEQSEQDPFRITAGSTVWSFSPNTGQLTGCSVSGIKTSLGNGPVLYAGTLKQALELPREWKVDIQRQADSVVIHSRNLIDDSSFQWTISTDGSAALDYDFAEIADAVAYCAVGFDLDESNIAGKRWLGAGPHRVWGNRLKGPQFGVWENAYNDNITGVHWGKPEFKGIFGNVDWMRVDLKSGQTLLIDTEPGASVGVMRPKNADETRNVKNGVGPVHA